MTFVKHRAFDAWHDYLIPVPQKTIPPSPPVTLPETRERIVRDEYGLHGTKRGAVINETGKRRIAIMLDSDILTAFRERAAGTGRGYQTFINQALRDYLTNCELEDTLRRVVRKELRETG